MEWVFFLIIIIIIVFIIWWLYGGQNFEFLGFKDINPPIKSLSYDATTESSQVCTTKSISKSVRDSKRKKQIYSEDVIGSIDHINIEHIRSVKSENDESLVPIDFKLPSLNISYYHPEDVVVKKGRKESPAESKGEALCRKILETAFRVPFPTMRPDFLVNPETGRNLELDGYNEDLHLAFEFNGIQHYKFPNRFHKSEEEFKNQVRRDLFKREACEAAGISLIVIPYSIPKSDIPKYIQDKIDELNAEKNYEDIPILSEDVQVVIT